MPVPVPGSLPTLVLGGLEALHHPRALPEFHRHRVAVFVDCLNGVVVVAALQIQAAADVVMNVEKI